MKNAILSFCIILSFLFISINVSAQFQREMWDWNDTLISKQKKYWDNGNIKIENIEENGKLIRYQYYETGKLQLKSGIVNERGFDSIYTIDPIIFEDTMYISKNNSEYPNGKITEYFENGNIKYSGQMKNRKKSGKWHYYYPNGNPRMTAKFNKDGILSGKFNEFFESGNIRLKAKLDPVSQFDTIHTVDPLTSLDMLIIVENLGDFGQLNFIEFSENGSKKMKGGLINYSVSEPIGSSLNDWIDISLIEKGRFGKWVFYAKDGKIDKRVKYDD